MDVLLTSRRRQQQEEEVESRQDRTRESCIFEKADRDSRRLKLQTETDAEKKEQKRGEVRRLPTEAEEEWQNGITP